ncbi:GUN4 domain-containing protein [Hydrocoleum sp. CS-953]|uniref:GUN4 domain-containing protein n=1 Tax=Hydrocoleum sp. CS-953 TaxID=1671698 RepID=UPI001FF06342|nr:GUN4 domain-containing protein [Hydrocoleum sp. CS-953]
MKKNQTPKLLKNPKQMKFLVRILALTFLALTLTNCSEQISGSEQQKQLEEAELQQQLEEEREEAERREQELKAEEQKQAENNIPLVSAKDVDYTKLRDLLAAGNWREADRETDKVMYKVADRRSEGWLRTEDVENFPCQDLATIDKLWVKYSDGKFGFSVQKQIYQSFGGTKEYDQEIWEKFGDKVGWRKEGEWLLIYNELTFDINNPYQGHLPRTRMCGTTWGPWGACGNIFSRAETCKL